MALIKCSECEKEVSSEAAACPGCGYPIKTAEPKLRLTFAEMASNTIYCPNCKSESVEKISTASKVGSAALFGVFAMGKLTKTYQCNKCGYRW